MGLNDFIKSSFGNRGTRQFQNFNPRIFLYIFILYIFIYLYILYIFTMLMDSSNIKMVLKTFLWVRFYWFISYLVIHCVRSKRIWVKYCGIRDELAVLKELLNERIFIYLAETKQCWISITEQDALKMLSNTYYKCTIWLIF